MMRVVEERCRSIPLSEACRVLGVPRANVYRRRQSPGVRCSRPRRANCRRIPDAERKVILQTLHDDRFLDQPPAEVHAALLTEGRYLCSIRTMHRVLAENSEGPERRAQRLPHAHARPRLTATAPNQVWTWDVSKLAGPEPGIFFSLYVILDLYSRYVVGWMVAGHENTALAKQLFSETLAARGIGPSQLTVHMDRGAPMTSHGFAQLLGALGVSRSFSRPRVSDDNAFSEAHFKTLKYQSDYPGRFADLEHARHWLGDFFAWYNGQHHHHGLALFTPEDVFLGRVDAVAAARQAALDVAYRAHPERFPNGAPRVRRPQLAVSINPVPPVAEPEPNDAPPNTETATASRPALARTKLRDVRFARVAAVAT